MKSFYPVNGQLFPDGNIIIEFSEPILFADGSILSQDEIREC